MHLNMTLRQPTELQCKLLWDTPGPKCWRLGCWRLEPGWHLVRCSTRMTMIGAAIGTTMVMGMEGPSTTTTTFMCLIRRSHHAATATILQTGRLQTVRAESAARAESAGLAE